MWHPLESTLCYDYRCELLGPSLPLTLHPTVYRATYPKTFKEVAAGSGDGFKVLVGVVTAMVIGTITANFLRDTG